MICVKVLNCFIKNFRCRRLTFLNMSLDVSLKSDKVKLYCTANNMFDICEPPVLNGMKVLDRNAFKKTVMVPCLVTSNLILGEVVKPLKKFLLKLLALKGVQEVDNKKRRIFLNPNLINSWNDFDENVRESLEKLDVNEENFSIFPLELGYENWGAETLLKAVLPKDTPPLTSFSLIGHIIHLNIKEELLDYKYVIAEILLDKIALARTVIYKKNIINSVYRNFEMEVLCGEPNFIASVTENKCRFELDFSKVYWNPRLATEHLRIVNALNSGDVLFDVFAGIGPFAIPAGKKKCYVFANDLNPESVKWLEHNITLNKKVAEYIKCFNKDGGDFILKDVRENMLKFWNDDCFSGRIHIVMNLPVIAPTFMKYFKRLYCRDDFASTDVEKIKKCLPIINCYFFTLDEDCGKTVFEQMSEMKLDAIEHKFQFVRKVSNSKLMTRITFSLPYEYLVEERENDKSDEPLPKRICTN